MPCSCGSSDPSWWILDGILPEQQPPGEALTVFSLYGERPIVYRLELGFNEFRTVTDGSERSDTLRSGRTYDLFQRLTAAVGCFTP